jgi:hypothetical protein
MRQGLALTLAVVAGAVLLSACHHTGPEGEGPGTPPGNDPVSVVRAFITDGVVDHNGYEACVYLTTRQQRAAARRVGAEECRQAFDLARLELGGSSIQTVHEVEGLAASSSVRGNQARVRLTTGGASVEFRLVKADFAEQEQFEAPDTKWRIAGGELALIPPQRA